MFQIIVKGGGWAPQRDTIDRSRALEYTDENLTMRYQPEGTLDLIALIEIPAAFLAETGGVGEQVVRFGSVSRVRVAGKNYQIDYNLDANLPGIPNAQFEELAADRDIEPFEFHRTHWAIKDRDLFKVLLTRIVIGRPAPKVFRIPEESTNSKLVSVMMPFDAGFTKVYEALRRAVAEKKMTCQRADDIWDDDATI